MQTLSRLVFVAGLYACGAPAALPARGAAAPAPVLQTPVPSAAKQAATVEPPPTPTPTPRPADEPCRPLQYAPSVCTGGRPLVVDDSAGQGATLTDLDDFDGWFRARGAAPPKRDTESWCQSARFGVEEAVICGPIRHVQRGRVGSGSWYYRVLERRQIYVVRGHRALSVFDRPVSLMPLDSFDVDDGPLFSIEIHLEDHALTLRERQPGSCAEARAELASNQRDAKRDKDTTQLGWSRLDQSLVEELCAGLGRYTWHATGNVRREALVQPRSGHTSF